MDYLPLLVLSFVSRVTKVINSDKNQTKYNDENV